MYIIITKHTHGRLTAITYCEDLTEENPPIMEFGSEAEAEIVAKENPLCQAYGYKIVRVDL